MGRKPLPESEARERARIGATIQAIRQTKGLSVEALANKVDYSRAYLANIEAGRKPLTYALLVRIADALQVKPEAIARRDYFSDAAA